MRALAVNNKFEVGTGNYLEVLQHYQLDFYEHGPWATVGKSARVQGWKLHLSSIPPEAGRLLTTVIPILLQAGASFKVAVNQKLLRMLNDGELGATQVGKFITIYPEGDEQTNLLAKELVKATQAFNGPTIVTDMYLGGVVYTRYGGFNPVIVRDRLGQAALCIYDRDQQLVVDAYQVPFSVPAGVTLPFNGGHLNPRNLDRTPLIVPAPAALTPGAAKPTKLFGPGYLVLEIIEQHAKGAVFRGIDLRSQAQVSVKVIKQARQFCLMDEWGRDMRTRLQHQAQLHKTLMGALPIPQVDPYFEVNGDGYLPLQNIEGQSIEAVTNNTLRNRPWHSLPRSQKVRLLEYLEKLVGAIQKMHARGYVHRDIAAANIWIGTDDEVYLLDLELAHAVDDPTPPFTLGTPGFMSPDQEQQRPPKFEDDIYALGCVMVMVFTGLDPRRVLFTGVQDRLAQLHQLADLPLSLCQTVVQCLAAEAGQRPSLGAVLAALSAYKCVLKSQTHSHPTPGRQSHLPEDLTELLTAAQYGLLEEVVLEPNTGLWLSPALDHVVQRRGQRTRTAYEVRRSLSRGVAGVVYVLSRLARFGYGTEAARARVQAAVAWLLRHEFAPDSELPGLHFGEAGVAVALTEAISAGLIERNAETQDFIRQALAQVPDWPDVTHGAAGQGIAALYCADSLKDLDLLHLSHRYAQYLVNTQLPEGCWMMPPGVEGMSGEILTGFAHGVSGMVYFLAEYARRFKVSKAAEAWRLGAQWLGRQAIATHNGRTLEWAYSNAHAERWQWWCHGGPGIVLTFLQLYEQTKEAVYADMANRALLVHPSELHYPNLSQCHGLSGLGEIYLEASRVLGNAHWYERATRIAEFLYALRRETGRGVTWLVEDPRIVTADLMVGCGGVTHFLLRYNLRSQAPSFPLLLNGQ